MTVLGGISWRIRRRVAPALRPTRTSARYPTARSRGAALGRPEECHTAFGGGERGGEWDPVGGAGECEGVGGGRVGLRWCVFDRALNRSGMGGYFVM